MNFRQIAFVFSLLTTTQMSFAQNQGPGVKDLTVELVDFANLQRAIDEMEIHVNDPDRNTSVNQLYARVPDFKIAYEKYKQRILNGYETFSRNAPIVVKAHNNRLEALFLKKRSEIAALEELRNEVSHLPNQFNVLNKNIKKHLSEFNDSKKRLDQQFYSEYLNLFTTSNEDSTQVLSQFYLEGQNFPKALAMIGASIAGALQTTLLTLTPSPLPGAAWLWVLDSGRQDVICPFIKGGDASYAANAIKKFSESLPSNVKKDLKESGKILFQGCITSICVNSLASYMLTDTKQVQKIEESIVKSSPVKIKRKDRIMKQGFVTRIQKMIKWASDEYSKTLPTAIFTESEK